MASNHMYKVEIICTTSGVMATTAITMEKNDIDKVTSTNTAHWES